MNSIYKIFIDNVMISSFEDYAQSKKQYLWWVEYASKHPLKFSTLRLEKDTELLYEKTKES